MDAPLPRIRICEVVSELTPDCVCKALETACSREATLKRLMVLAALEHLNETRLYQVSNGFDPVEADAAPITAFLAAATRVHRAVCDTRKALSGSPRAEDQMAARRYFDPNRELFYELLADTEVLSIIAPRLQASRRSTAA